jgi:hypothetical protein
MNRKAARAGDRLRPSPALAPALRRAHHGGEPFGAAIELR